MTDKTHGPAEGEIERKRFEEACDWFLQLRETPESSELVAAWLVWSRSDPRNGVAFEEVRALWWVTRDVGVRPAPSARIGARGRGAHWLAAAAAIMAIAVGCLWCLYGGSSRINSTTIVASFATAQREHRQFQLADGSSIEMAGDSRLVARFGPDRRQIELERGEAYFRVARDAARPFTVAAGSTHVTAVGTSFNVRAGYDTVVIAVEEGVVVVEPTVAASGAALPSPPPESGSRRRIRLLKGQEASVGVNTHELQVMSIEPDAVASWREGRLRFAREPLRSVVASVLASSGQTIILADPSLGELRFTGTVFSPRVDDWVQGLPQIFPVSVRHEGRTFVVSRRE